MEQSAFQISFWSDYILPIVRLLAPVAITALLLSTVSAFVLTRTTGKAFREKLAFLLPFCLLGAVAGLVTGASQEPVIGGLLTGLLALVAALASNIYSKDSLPELKVNLPPAIVLLCISAVVTLGLGRVQKAELDDFDRRFAQWKTQYEQVDVPLILMRERYEECRRLIARERIDRCEEILTK